MSDSKKARFFSVIAAVCAVLTGIFMICYVMALKREGLSFEEFFSVGHHSVSGRFGYVNPVQFILSGILYFVLAVLLLIGKKNIGFLIASGLLALSGAFDLYQYLDCGMRIWGEANILYLLWLLSYLFLFLSYASLFVLLLLHIVPLTKGKAGKMSVLHFVPAGLFFIGKTASLLGHSCVMMTNTSTWETSFNGFDVNLFFWNWEGKEWLGFGFLPAAGIGMMIFLGLWLMKTAAPVRQNVNIIGQADKLQTYKELMDAGMITREEFENKKKDILGS